MSKSIQENRAFIADNGTNNSVSIGSGFDLSKVRVNIVGNDNVIKIESTTRCNTGPIDIFIKGNGCHIAIQKDLFVDGGGLNIQIGNAPWEPVSGVSVDIGEKVGVGGCSMITYNSNSQIEIGKHVMMAWGITLYNTDAHPIYDLETGRLKNYVSTLHIGDYCWIGANATILKNVFLADGTIVGWGAVVSRSCPHKNCALAGNPARKVADNLLWKEYDSDYIFNKRPETDV